MEDKKPVVFHSSNIADTKAKEKREVFVKVEEKKTLKQSAEEFQRKFAEAKAHAAESRAKIENPGVDASGVIRSHTRKPFPVKLALKILIPVLILGGAGLAVYLNWGTIHHEFFEVSEARAYELLSSNPERAISMFEKVLAEETDSKKKESKSIIYAHKFLDICLGENGYSCSNTELEAIRKFAEIAESITPSYQSATLMMDYYSAKGDQSNLDAWSEKAGERYIEEDEYYGEG